MESIWGVARFERYVALAKHHRVAAKPSGPSRPATATFPFVAAQLHGWLTVLIVMVEHAIVRSPETQICTTAITYLDVGSARLEAQTCVRR